MNENYSELEMAGLKTKAVKGAGINIAAQFLGFVCHTVGVVVLARLLAPKDFGLVAMVTAFSLWFMNFGANGFTEYIIQKQEISKEEINSIFWLHVFLATMLAFGFIFFGLFLVKFYAEPSLWGISAAMSSSFILYALSTTPMALLKREMKFQAIAIAELVAVILSIIFAISVALTGMTYWAVVTRQLTVPLVTMIAAWILCPWRPSSPRYLSSGLPGLKYAIHVYGNFSLGYLMRNLDKVFLGKYHGPDLLGNYDRATHLSAVPANQLLTPIHSVALATLSRLRDDKERFFTYYIKAVSIVAFPGVIAALVLTLSANDLILLLLGPKWTEAGMVVMALGPGIAAMLVYETHSWLHLSLGTPDKWLRWNIFASLVTITAFIIAAPFGAVAMAIAYSAKTYALVIPGLWYAGRPIQFNLRVLIRLIWAYFVSAIIVCISWLYLSVHWLPMGGLLSGLSPLNRIVITSFIASFLYIGLVIILQRSLRSISDILSIITLIFSRRKA
jgi:PST family polysaccharide transporter